VSTRARSVAAVAGCVAILAGLVTTLLAGVANAAPPPAASPLTSVQHVVVVGVPGLRWEDVTAADTPALWSLVEHASVGALSVRAAKSVTCPVDGWATLGAGNRARGPANPGPGCPGSVPLLEQAPTGAAQQVLHDVNDGLLFGTQIGALGNAMHARGMCTAAVGAGASLAAADAAGRVRHPGGPGDPATYTTCPLTVVGIDAIAVRPPASPEDGAAVDANARRAAVRSADDALARILAARPAGSLLIVAGISETGRTAAHLHVLAVDGPGLGHRLLDSPSTRRAPYVQLIDIAPTVLAALGVPRPDAMVGQPIRAGAAAAPVAEQVERFVRLERAALLQSDLVPPFFAILVAIQALVYGATALVLRFGAAGRHRNRLLIGTRIVAAAAGAGVVATYLANLLPWARAGHPLPALLGALLLFTLAITALALAGPWRRRLLGPSAVVAGVTFVVLAADLVSGARLQVDSLAGYSPLVAGRFAGVGNLAFAVFAAAALLTAAFACSGRTPRQRLVIVTVIGVVATVIDGAPMWGDDFGGVLALVPAFAVLGMLMTRGRISWKRLAVALLAAVAVVAAFAFADYLRPAADRTHLGRFVQDLLDGHAGTVIVRKGQANLRVLRTSVLAGAVPLAALAIAVLAGRPWGGLGQAFENRPQLRGGLVATAVMAVIGFAVNDSGIAIPAMALAVAVPVAVMAAVETVRLDPPDRRVEAAAPPAAGVTLKSREGGV
jgi:hypothetical protein